MDVGVGPGRSPINQAVSRLVKKGTAAAWQGSKAQDGVKLIKDLLKDEFFIKAVSNTNGKNTAAKEICSKLGIDDNNGNIRLSELFKQLSEASDDRNHKKKIAQLGNRIRSLQVRGTDCQDDPYIDAKYYEKSLADQCEKVLHCEQTKDFPGGVFQIYDKQTWLRIGDNFRTSVVNEVKERDHLQTVYATIIQNNKSETFKKFKRVQAEKLKEFELFTDAQLRGTSKPHVGFDHELFPGHSSARPYMHLAHRDPVYGELSRDEAYVRNMKAVFKRYIQAINANPQDAKQWLIRLCKAISFLDNMTNGFDMNHALMQDDEMQQICRDLKKFTLKNIKLLPETQGRYSLIHYQAAFKRLSSRQLER